MTNPLYSVTISHCPTRVSGQTFSVISGVTQSVIGVWDAEYFVACMPELGISATGADYRTALNNLLVIATASSVSDTGYPPYSSIRHW